MTKVLLISNKSDITTDFIVRELSMRNVTFYRFNTEELGNTVFISLQVDSNTFRLQDEMIEKEFDLLSFSSVYFRRPELPFLNDTSLSTGEAQFIRNESSLLLEGIYKILAKAYWVSPLVSIREAENKIHQLILAREIGLRIPHSLISNVYETSKAFFIHNRLECIVKPLKSGFLEDTNGSRVIFTSSITSFPVDSAEIESCPHFFQNEIRKKVDVRVTVAGDRIFAVAIHSQDSSESKTDWRRSDKQLKYSKFVLPAYLEELCFRLLKVMNLRFGAIDFVLNEEEEYIFLEINPNGQWAWIETQTSYEISKQLVNMLCDETN
jgi:glutathione synthase/RimK-type ligase-like ATP-grasp enzyme